MRKRHIIELVLIALAVVAMVMKLFHIPGSNILLVVSLFTISSMYFIGGYLLFNDVNLSKKNPGKKVSPKRAVFTIGFGLAYSTLLLGLLFKLMLWSGADSQLGIGLSFTILATLFLLLYIQFKKIDIASVKQLLIRGVIGILVGMFFLNTSQVSLANVYYRDNPEYRDAMIRTLENPNDPEAHEELRKFREGYYVKPGSDN